MSKQDSVSDERGKRDDDTVPNGKRCRYEPSKGARCPLHAVQGSDFCTDHDREMRGV